MQRPNGCGARAVAAVHLGSGLHGIRIDRDDRPQGRTLHVVRSDPVEIEAGQLSASQLASSKRSVDAGDRRFLETKLALLGTGRRGRSHQHRTGHRQSKDTSHKRSPNTSGPVSARQLRDVDNASLAKSVASKFRGDTRVERFRRREIGAAAFRIVLVPQAGETAAIK
jgi:hypothetical protein